MGKTVATKIPQDAYEELKARAESEGLSIAAILRNLIYDYLGKPQVNRSKPVTREEFEELKKRVEELERLLRSKNSGLQRFYR